MLINAEEAYERFSKKSLGKDTLQRVVATQCTIPKGGSDQL